MRYLEELLIEGAHKDLRPLNQIDDFVEDLRRGLGTEAVFILDLLDAVENELATAVGIDYDTGVLENRLIRSDVGDSGLDVQHAKAAGSATRLDAGKVHRNDLVAEQGDDPTQGATKRFMTAAPALRTRPGKLGDRGGDYLGDDLGCGAGRLLDVKENVLAALVLANNKLGSICPLAAGKALGGLSGIAVGIERDSGSRAAKAQRLGLGSLGEVGNDDGDATRGAHRANVAVGEAGGVKAVANQVAKLLGRLVQRDSGQLFAAQLDQIITCSHD